MWHDHVMAKNTESSKSSKVAPKAKQSALPHKLGTDRGETAKRQRTLDKNFKQSRDVREDRGVRKLKTGPQNPRQTGR